MSLEAIHQFEMCGCLFTVLWDTSSCLLRVTEGYTSGDRSSYMAADLTQMLYDGSGDGHVPRVEAIRVAPEIAEQLLIEVRQRDVGFMQQLVDSPDLLDRYPVYHILRLRNDRGEKAVMIWSSHIHNLYLGRDGSWEWVESPASLDKARHYIEEHYGYKEDTPGDGGRETPPWWRRLFGR